MKPYVKNYCGDKIKEIKKSHPKKKVYLTTLFLLGIICTNAQLWVQDLDKAK